jgi:uncharacterized SAM-dependent methyltransferase
VQVEAYIPDEGINLTDVLTLITILQIVFGDPDHVTTTEKKLEVLKQTNRDFSTNYTEYQHFAADI